VVGHAYLDKSGRVLIGLYYPDMPISAIA
jgi:hypothetical protein